MVHAAYKIADLKRAVGAKKLGTYPALPGWSCEGKRITSVTFTRFEVVEYHGDADHKFQDIAYLED